MTKEEADKLLEDARKSFEARTRWYHRFWRWLRNLCPLCGAKMEYKLGAFSSVKTCSRHPNYHPYAGEMNFVPVMLIALVIMAITILILASRNSERKAREAGEIYREPSIRPRDGYYDGFEFNFKGLK